MESINTGMTNDEFRVVPTEWKRVISPYEKMWFEISLFIQNEIWNSMQSGDQKREEVLYEVLHKINQLEGIWRGAE